MLGKEIVLGIDASNIRLGGGVTHIVELLNHFDPNESKIKNIVIWGNRNTLSKIPNFSWLKKIEPWYLEKNLLYRTLWQLFLFTNEVKKNNCSILFVLGGFYLGKFSPFVVISQNLLPFQPGEIGRYMPSIRGVKFYILKIIQGATFKRASGIIFLTEFAKLIVISAIGSISARSIIIPHGLSKTFLSKKKLNYSQPSLGIDSPINLIYVSNIDLYKHQVKVIEAIALLRERGYLIEIQLIGPATEPSLTNLNNAIEKYDPYGEWVSYIGQVPYDEIDAYYRKSNIGIFASSCETFGMILLEKMAVGLPIACSSLSSMSETLENGGLYFDPVNELSIANVIEAYIQNPDLREEKSRISNLLAKQYSWSKCAKSTFKFLESIALEEK